MWGPSAFGQPSGGRTSHLPTHPPIPSWKEDGKRATLPMPTQRPLSLSRPPIMLLNSPRTRSLSLLVLSSGTASAAIATAGVEEQPPGVPETAAAENSELEAKAENPWWRLDAMAEELSSQGLNGDSHATHISGFFRSNYAHSKDLRGSGTTNDLGGINLDAVRLEVSGHTDEFDVFISGDAFSGNLTLLDALVTVPLHPGIAVVAGQFRPPLLRSGLLHFSDTLFLFRTRNGIFASLRDRGAMLRVDEGNFHIEAALHNGADSAGSDFLYTGRVSMDLAGRGVSAFEGAYGAEEDVAATIGISAQEDEALDSGEIVALEAAMTMAPFSLQAEYLNYAASFDLDSVTGLPIPGSRSDTNPYSITASAMVVPDQVEVALRFDDFEDNLDRELYTLGANYYVRGHDAKVQLNLTHLESDGGDEDILAVGLTVAF